MDRARSLGLCIYLRLDFSNCFIDGAFVLGEDGSDDLQVDGGCSEQGWVEEIDVEGELDEVVEGDRGEDKAEEGIRNSADAEDNPVGEPLTVIASALRLECFEAHVRGVDESNQVANQTSTDVQQRQHSQERANDQNHVTSLHLRLLHDDL